MRNLKRSLFAVAAILLITLPSCLKSEGNKTQGSAYATIITNKLGMGKFVAIEDISYGTITAILQPSSSVLDSLELNEGDRIKVKYLVDWDNQPTDREAVVASIEVLDSWKPEEINYTESAEFVSDSIPTVVGPFFTYDSNGRSIVTIITDVHNTIEGGAPHSLTLERLNNPTLDSAGKVTADTLNFVYKAGDITTDKKTTQVYQSFILPDSYKESTLNLVINVAGKGYLSFENLKQYSKEQGSGAYFSLPFKYPAEAE